MPSLLAPQRDLSVAETLDINAIHRGAVDLGALCDSLLASSKARFEYVEMIANDKKRDESVAQMIHSEELLERGLQHLREGLMMLEQSVRSRA